MPKNTEPASLVGADILNLVTTGMYHTPLAVYREYLQNAADSIERSSWPGQGRVEININPALRTVTITDNGPGLTHSQAIRNLIPIARSRKQRGTDRGFRGIGRLSGLAFADKVTFRTRSSKKQPVTQITWDGITLRSSAVANADPEQIIKSCVNVSTSGGSDWPNNFFEVEIENVSRHAADRILNASVVRRYIGEVGPVPMSEDFPFTKEIDDLFVKEKQMFTLEVTLTGEKTPIRRVHGAWLKFSEDRRDTFAEFQPVRIPSVDSEQDAAIGWVSHSSYFGAIPKELGVRGLRLRVGNIQVGDEYALDTLFREERFNRWCVGEVHILDERILPNGRRDYFDPSPHVRQVENHLESIIQGIVKRCRNASSNRVMTRRAQSMLEHMESAYNLAGSGYLKAPDAKTLVDQTLRDLEGLEELLNLSDTVHGENARKLFQLKNKLMQFRPRRGRPCMGKVRSGEIAIYQKIFNALTELCPTPTVAKEIIEGVIQYTNTSNPSEIVNIRIQR